MSGGPNHDLEALTHPVLIGLRDYWRRIAEGRAMPARRDFEPLDVTDILPHVVLFDVEGDPPRFRFRLVGTAATERAGLDPTGRYFNDFADSEVAIERMVACVRERRPYFVVDAFVWSNRPSLYYHTLTLPLSDDGEIVDMLVSATVIEAE
jgi:hypothetical protein